MPNKNHLSHTFRSLSNRDFRYLFLGLIAQMTGFEMQLLARGYLAYDLTNSAFILGVITAGSALPTLFFGLFGGAMSDRMDRKKLIQIGQTAAALLVLFIAISITTNTLTWFHLLASAILRGMIFAFTMPARQAIVPQIVGKENITNAMALFTGGFSLTMMITPAIAGLVYALMGPAFLYYTISVFTFTSVLLTSKVTTPTRNSVKHETNVASEIKDGMSYLFNNKMLLPIFAITFSFALIAMPFEFLLPVYVVDMYGRGPEALGILISLIGVGSLIGSSYVAYVGDWNRGKALIVTSLLTSLCLMLLAIFPVFWIASLIMLVFGLGYAGNFTLSQSIVIQKVDDKYRGRVSSLFMMNFSMVPLGTLPASLIVQHYGGQIALATQAIILFVIFSSIFITQKSLRKIQ